MDLCPRGNIVKISQSLGLEPSQRKRMTFIIFIDITRNSDKRTIIFKSPCHCYFEFSNELFPKHIGIFLSFVSVWPQTLNIFSPAFLGEKRCFSSFFILPKKHMFIQPLGKETIYSPAFLFCEYDD